MKIKVVIVVLVLACVGLGISMLATKKQAADQQKKDTDTISDLSGQIEAKQKLVDSIGQISLTYSNDWAASQQQLALSQQQAAQFSNSLTTAAVTLTETKSELEGKITGLNSRISDLEVQNKALDQRAGELTNTLAELNATIEKTLNQLAISETNRTYLEQELKKQLALKAELERKFNDLTELRTQVKKLKEEAYVARRIQLMKNDTGGKKGAELLIQRTAPAGNAAAADPSTYNLNVEVGSDGSVKVIPPLGATNIPAGR